MKYKKYAILFLLIANAYLTFNHFNMSLKFHIVNDIPISQNPYKIVTIRNNDDIKNN